MERRALDTQLRPDGRRLTGYAARFGTEARIGGGVVETIAPGAFAPSLASGRDVLALVDHNPTRVLARTRSGTLRLSEDSVGLAFDIDMPNTQTARDLLEMAERGDLGGMSFGFTVIDQERRADRRVLRSVELLEISVVSAWPAYQGTTVDARSAPVAMDRRARLLRLWELGL